MAIESRDGRGGGAVAGPHRQASEIGRDVLAAGGNALDAAIATNAMLTVVYPQSVRRKGEHWGRHCGYHAEDRVVECAH
jgi:hypothetical protein